MYAEKFDEIQFTILKPFCHELCDTIYKVHISYQEDEDQIINSRITKLPIPRSSSYIHVIGMQRQLEIKSLIVE